MKTITGSPADLAVSAVMPSTRRRLLQAAGAILAGCFCPSRLFAMTGLRNIEASSRASTTPDGSAAWSSTDCMSGAASYGLICKTVCEYDARGRIVRQIVHHADQEHVTHYTYYGGIADGT